MHYRDMQFTDYDSWGGIMLGTPCSDLRLIGVYGNGGIGISNIVDYYAIDKTIPFTGEDSLRQRQSERFKENLHRKKS